MLQHDEVILLLGSSTCKPRSIAYSLIIIPQELEDTHEYGKRKKYRVDFDLASFGFPEEELDVPVYFGDSEKRSWIFVNFFCNYQPFMVSKEEWTIREIHTRLT